MHGSYTLWFCAIAISGAFVGCGGATFDDLNGFPNGDGGSAAIDTGAPSPSPHDASSADTSLPPSTGTCTALAPGATDVYVDQRFTGASATGTAACPLVTILDGLRAASLLLGTRTVHVAGGIPALVYTETSAVSVGPNITLKGAGEGKTAISASGVCGSGTCAVIVEGGGTLDGFTVVSPAGDGISATLSSLAPNVKNVVVSGSRGNGILALGAIELGPNIVATTNGGQGLESPQSASGLVHIVAGANAFDANKANGVNIEGSATLSFEGGSASGNTLSGIRIANGVPADTPLPTHVITGLSALNNSAGIAAFNGPVLKVRATTLRMNTLLGLYYAYGPNSSLDIGTAMDPGHNAFGSATVANRNGKVGIYLCGSHGTGTLPAVGDTWTACAPTQTFVDNCNTVPSSYADVAYSPTVGAPVMVTGCTVGP